MKKLFKIGLLYSFIYILSSCNPTLQITDKTSNRSKIVKISKKIIIKNNHAYTTSKKGVPMMIDLNIYSIETVNKKIKNENFFLILTETLEVEE